MKTTRVRLIIHRYRTTEAAEIDIARQMPDGLLLSPNTSMRIITLKRGGILSALWKAWKGETA